MSSSQFYQPTHAADITYHLDAKTTIRVQVIEGRQGMMQHRFSNLDTAKQFVQWAKEQAGQNDAFPDLISFARPIKEGEFYVVRLTQEQFYVLYGMAGAFTEATYCLDAKQKIHAQITIGNAFMLQHRCVTKADADNLLDWAKKQIAGVCPEINRARVQQEASGKFLFRLSVRQFELLILKQSNFYEENVKKTPEFKAFSGNGYKLS